MLLSLCAVFSPSHFCPFSPLVSRFFCLSPPFLLSLLASNSASPSRCLAFSSVFPPDLTELLNRSEFRPAFLRRFFLSTRPLFWGLGVFCFFLFWVLSLVFFCFLLVQFDFLCILIFVCFCLFFFLLYFSSVLLSVFFACILWFFYRFADLLHACFANLRPLPGLFLLPHCDKLPTHPFIVQFTGSTRSAFYFPVFCCFYL
jgi:hypothetical protein